ncbi:unnamed protein product [Strongylus vulgaris]|uniref:Uncharacterized protein n=1 Tax=Strongylus vulgaris TaxID=40348 RepID=A0A3P7J9F0_STRVU|nr:unnamed protein product [Strongylus vulgaris]
MKKREPEPNAPRKTLDCVTFEDGRERPEPMGHLILVDYLCSYLTKPKTSICHCAQNQTVNPNDNSAAFISNPRCTCPHPPNYCPPSRRASIQTTQIVRHPSLISHCTSVPPVIYEYPLRSSYAPSYSSRPSLPHFHPAPHYPPYRGYYGGFPEPERRHAPSVPPSAMPSMSSQKSYYSPRFYSARIFYPGYDGRSPENAMRPVYHLRAYPKQRSQLFVVSER